MASIVMHIAIAKKINEELKMNENDLYLGVLAPELSSILKRKKTKSHFYNKNSEIDLDKFIDKYKRSMKSSFVMGYYIHLYTDYLWNKKVASDFIDLDSITLLNGTKIKVKESDAKKILKNDFSNINIDLMRKYDLDLSFVNNKINIPRTKLDEIPVKKLPLVLEKAAKIINDSKKEKTVVLKTRNIYKFIEDTSKEIIENLKDLKFI